ELMGCSNPHPHGQIWASDALPNEAAAEDRHQRAHLAAHGTPLLVEYARHERDRRVRVVHETAGWLAVVPYWAVWPFETLILPTRLVWGRRDAARDARRELGDLRASLLRAYDQLLGVSSPYSLGGPGAPFAAGGREHGQLPAHISPPLLRSATVKK